MHSTPTPPPLKKKKNQGPTVIWSCLHHCPDFHFPVLFLSLLSMMRFTSLFPLLTFALYNFCLFFYSFIFGISSHISSPDNPYSSPFRSQLLWNTYTMKLFPKAKLIIISSPTDLKTAALLVVFQHVNFWAEELNPVYF